VEGRTREVVRACYVAGEDLAHFPRALLARLRRAVPVDAAFFATADPGTLLFTAAWAEPPLGEAGARFLDNEFGTERDVNRFAGLARSPRTVATLDEATRGDWRSSPRSREIMAPLGLGDEMRVALRAGGATWGFLCLHREGTHRFSTAEAELLRRVAPHAGEAIRRSVARTVAGGGEEAGEAAVIIAEDGRVSALTAAAAAGLAELGCATRAGDPLPFPLLALVRRLEALETGALPGRPAAVTLSTARGSLVEVHAARLSEPGEGGPVTLTLAPAGSRARASLLLAAHRLTAAQQRVAALVLQGRSTAQIAAELRVGDFTVQDHLKAVFAKVGVGSRRELVSALTRPARTSR
jgi:DNA-binding CsgD family transcriptional regulator